MEIEQIEYFKLVEMEVARADLISKFARDMTVGNIDQVKIEADINYFKNEQSTPDGATSFDILNNLARTYFADYSTNNVNEANLARDTVDNLFKIDSLKHFLLFSLEAKSNKTKSVNDLIKLCRELKNTIKAVNIEQRSGIVLCGILVKGNCCDVYCMNHNYDGLYRVMLLKKICLPRNYYEMHQL
ncbi:hypothetical protein BD408DRAFT_445931 [Parasitella parasitica]|nr:hypothetical protein BD408DRAFT_445931 [Parasitella parasitica]